MLPRVLVLDLAAVVLVDLHQLLDDILDGGLVLDLAAVVLLDLHQLLDGVLGGCHISKAYRQVW